MGIGAVLSSIMAVVLSLALVLGLAWGAIWLLKKLQDRQMGVDGEPNDVGNIRFLRSLPLGQRERVALIELNGERLLLGITAGGISLLARYDKGSATFEDAMNSASEAQNPDKQNLDKK
jgi:flagellar protein FliO/FliZ